MFRRSSQRLSVLLPIFNSGTVRQSQLRKTANLNLSRKMGGSTRSKDGVVRTAGIIIIGDEVLSSKTVDTNSAWFAKYCFELGIDLRRCEVIPDEADEIGEAVRRMSANYDFVVTSGGIGPTHDDLTYPSIAQAFDADLVLHEETIARMKKLSVRKINWDVPDDDPEIVARRRMAQFPRGAEVVFPAQELWVPIVVVNENVHILPGIPRLFQGLLTGYRTILAPKLDPANRQTRLLVATSRPESSISPFLTALQKRVEGKGVKVGSYPRGVNAGVVVSLLGKDVAFLETLIPEVERELDGKQIDTTAERKREDERASHVTAEVKSAAPTASSTEPHAVSRLSFPPDNISPLLPPLDFQKWLKEEGHRLQPPVNNYCLYAEKDFIVMVVGGPNERNDYHLNDTEEWFFQVKGDMCLKVVEEGKTFKDIWIREGHMFLLPANTPHNPVRFADTIGLVIERVRPGSTQDRLRWYCRSDAHANQDEPVVVHETNLGHVKDLGSQLKPAIREWQQSEELRKCRQCGTIAEPK
ncbi:3-hydroxyanthranilic acid dioxygenase [Savitreella phatthalungensis]